MAKDIKFEIIKHIGVLSESGKGWKDEIKALKTLLDSEL